MIEHDEPWAYRPPESVPVGEEPVIAELVSAPPPPAAVTPVREQPDVTWRELAAVVLMVVLADVAVFRGRGMAGYAAFFAGGLLLLLLGTPRWTVFRTPGRKRDGDLPIPPLREDGPSDREPLPARPGPVAFMIVALMLLAVSFRLAWSGSGLQVACGAVLMVAFAMLLAGIRPYALAWLVFTSQSLLSGFEGLVHYRRTARGLVAVEVRRGAWLDVALPLAAFIAFGLLFVVANPDLLQVFGERLRWLLTALRESILDVLPTWQEALFWLGVLWITVGLLRPAARLHQRAMIPGESGEVAGRQPLEAPLYGPFRNTLVTVVALFAAYLVFEFNTLWFRQFPPGFHYSGYAHEGAAWLTAALGLATVVLSLIFRGAVLRDARLPRLRRLAWLWSLENVILSVAVFHRMFIYVGFNGMTRMRTVGLFGISCVVVGLILVVWKIVQRRDFAWLLRHQLWALGFFVFLYALTPVDYLVHRYNVRRIMAGDPAPSVQVSVHPIDSEGFLSLLPLAHAPDEIVREGVLAMLAEKHREIEWLAKRRQEEGWTSYQVAERVLLERLRAFQVLWEEYADPVKRREARARFDQYAYRWY